jgi:3-oxoacyl-[acyl-carrier protein] reductase
MDLGLKNKNAIIGASTQGLGFACAKEFLQEGANVLISGRRQNTLDEAVESLRKISAGKVHGVCADLSTRKGVSTLFEHAQQAFQSFDILITNTGGPPMGLFESHDLDAWEATYKLLLESAVSMMKAVIPSMKAQGSGRIIAITSQAVKQPIDGLILSNSLRAGVTGLCKTLSNELGSYGITVNSVLPGSIRTNRLKSLLQSPDMVKAIENSIPLGHVGEPEEFAAMVAFLASERSSYVTGQSNAGDGGCVKSLL